MFPHPMEATRFVDFPVANAVPVLACRILRRAAPAGTLRWLVIKSKKAGPLAVGGSRPDSRAAEAYRLDSLTLYQNNSFKLNCVCRAAPVTAVPTSDVI